MLITCKNKFRVLFAQNINAYICTMTKNEIPPIDRSGAGRPNKYNFHKLEINEYVKVSKTNAHSATQAAYIYAKKSGKKFAKRKVDGEHRIYREK